MPRQRTLRRVVRPPSRLGFAPAAPIRRQRRRANPNPGPPRRSTRVQLRSQQPLPLPLRAALPAALDAAAPDFSPPPSPFPVLSRTRLRREWDWNALRDDDGRWRPMTTWLVDREMGNFGGVEPGVAPDDVVDLSLVGVVNLGEDKGRIGWSEEANV